MCVCVCVSVCVCAVLSLSVVSDSVGPHGLMGSQSVGPIAASLCCTGGTDTRL